MFAVLPIVGGILLGWLASRRLAIVLQIVFVAIASFVMIDSAPKHGHTSASMWWIAPVLALARRPLAGARLLDRRPPQ